MENETKVQAESDTSNNTENTVKSNEQKKPKKSKSNAELEKAKSELEKCNDLLLRTAAEFDNYKKRTEREKLSVAEYAKCSIIKNLLPIIDNAERALKSDGEGTDYTKGLEMIVKQLSAMPEKLSMETIAQAGNKFDPLMHEAVMHIEDESLEENTIAEVLQQGYKLGDTVIRHAMVKVAN